MTAAPVDYNDALLDMIDSLNDAQAKRVAELRTVVERDLSKLSYTQDLTFKSFRTVFLVRHLIARKWDVKGAYDMIMAAAEWRNTSGIDKDPLFPPLCEIRGFPMDELVKLRGFGLRDTTGEMDYVLKHLRQIAAAAWHKYDKKGRPVYIERTGHFKVKELIERLTSINKPGADLSALPIKYHLHSNEVGATIVRYCNEKIVTGTPNTCVTIIMDCDGLSTEHLYGPALEILKTQGKFDEKVYAEGMYRLYVVNCPAVISAAWAIIKLWVDERTRGKISFLKPAETKKALLEVIDEENLPEYLGGKCKCEGGCVPDNGFGNDGPVPLGPTKEINIKAGAKEVVEVPIKPENKIQYFIYIAENDINFEVSFEANAKGGGKLPVKTVEKHKLALEGAFEGAPAEGKLVLSFDNSYSWLKSKTVVYLVLIDGKPFGGENCSPLVKF